MSVNYSTAVRIAMLDSIEAAMGAGPKLKFYTGSKPALCSDAATGTVVAILVMTGDFMSDASAASNVVTKAKNPASTWSSTALNRNTIDYYRIYNNADTVCHEQGTVTLTGSGGDIQLDNTTVATGQTITVTSKVITAGNA